MDIVTVPVGIPKSSLFVYTRLYMHLYRQSMWIRFYRCRR